MKTEVVGEVATQQIRVGFESIKIGRYFKSSSTATNCSQCTVITLFAFDHIQFHHRPCSFARLVFQFGLPPC